MNRVSSGVLAALAVMVLVGSGSAVATVKPHGLISDGAVLQQGVPVPIWGTATEGESVTVHFQDQKVTTKARDGKWMIRLVPLRPGGPFEMVIRGENTVVVKDILVGEVWVCGGQSNMEWPLEYSVDGEGEEAIAKSADPMLRLFTVPRAALDEPASDIAASWHECGPDAVRHFSAVAYYFGRDLRKALGVPMGLINNSVGGSIPAGWMSRTTLEADPQLRYYLLLPFYFPLSSPAMPDNPLFRASGLYNGMLAPLLPYGIRGVIWYQGESSVGRALEYRKLFPAMIANWRHDWGQGDFPFLFVQLAPLMKVSPDSVWPTEPSESAWAVLRESQFIASLTVPRTAMVVITDVGDENDIHPRRKEPVGARLALAARAIAYGQKIEYSGPVYESMKIRGNRIVLTFDHVGGGVVVRGDELQGFAICGEDRKFVWAKAEIRGADQVIVWSPAVVRPMAVRYGWANYPVVNLYNKEGLPASPFRTDDMLLLPGPQ